MKTLFSFFKPILKWLRYVSQYRENQAFMQEMNSNLLELRQECAKVVKNWTSAAAHNQRLREALRALVNLDDNMKDAGSPLNGNAYHAYHFGHSKTWDGARALLNEQ